jgi:hypothetical protein
MAPPTPDYSPPPRVRRTFATWLILMLVWTAGVLMFVLWAGIAVAVLFKLLT